MKVQVYVEGTANDAQRTECRRAFQKLFISAGLEGRLPKVFACGSRQNAFEDFCLALKTAKDNEMPILLVDSEEPKGNLDAWEHLARRRGDNWQKPANATNDHVFLMIVCMEAWFLADRNKLSEYFGNGFRINALPQRPVVEEVSKQELYDGLRNATRDCNARGGYKKGSHSFQILELLNAPAIINASPEAERFFEALRRVC